MTENVIVKKLQGIAAKLTDNPEAQKDLMQEMFMHLIRLQTAEPTQPLGRHLENCEVHARSFFHPGRGADAAEPEVASPSNRERGNDAAPVFSSLVGQIQIQGQLITNDIVKLLLPLLSKMQQQVLSLLMKGYGIRQAARELGVTHPAVIKQRNKIARIARELLPECPGLGVLVAVRSDSNGSGRSHSNPEMCGS